MPDGGSGWVDGTDGHSGASLREFSKALNRAPQESAETFGKNGYVFLNNPRAQLIISLKRVPELKSLHLSRPLETTTQCFRLPGAGAIAPVNNRQEARGGRGREGGARWHGAWRGTPPDASGALLTWRAPRVRCGARRRLGVPGAPGGGRVGERRGHERPEWTGGGRGTGQQSRVDGAAEAESSRPCLSRSVLSCPGIPRDAE